MLLVVFWIVLLKLLTPLMVFAPATSVCPSGLNASDSMVKLPGGIWPSGRGCAGSVTSHSWIVPPLSPLASMCPSGLNATD